MDGVFFLTPALFEFFFLTPALSKGEGGWMEFFSSPRPSLSFLSSPQPSPKEREVGLKGSSLPQESEFLKLKKAEKACASSAPINPNQINYEKTIWALICLSE
ncbi:hypothetical protein DTW91_05565 [Chryseobacterium sp. SC28]|nr:hypothetical protein DTW91_05565 [Chryseobacterium sp. SC28]